MQNCFFLQAKSKSKTALLGFTVPACFPHSSISHGQDFCACFPTFLLSHHEFFHAVIQEFSSAAHLTSFICSFPSHHLSTLLKTPWNVLFCKSTTCTGCSLVTYMLAKGWQNILQVWRQLLPQAQNVLSALLVGCSCCSPHASAHPLISPCQWRRSFLLILPALLLAKASQSLSVVCFP